MSVTQTRNNLGVGLGNYRKCRIRFADFETEHPDNRIPQFEQLARPYRECHQLLSDLSGGFVGHSRDLIGIVEMHLAEPVEYSRVIRDGRQFCHSLHIDKVMKYLPERIAIPFVEHLLNVALPIEDFAAELVVWDSALIAVVGGFGG